MRTTSATLLATLLLGLGSSVSADSSWVLGEFQGGMCGGSSSRLTGSGTKDCEALSGVHSVDGSSGDGTSTGVYACYYTSSDCSGTLVAAVGGFEQTCQCCDNKQGYTSTTCGSRVIVSGSSASDCPGYPSDFDGGCD